MSLPQTPSLIQIQLYLNGKLSSQTRPSQLNLVEQISNEFINIHL